MYIKNNLLQSEMFFGLTDLANKPSWSSEKSKNYDVPNEKKKNVQSKEARLAKWSHTHKHTHTASGVPK